MRRNTNLGLKGSEFLVDRVFHEQVKTVITLDQREKILKAESFGLELFHLFCAEFKRDLSLKLINGLFFLIRDISVDFKVHGIFIFVRVEREFIRLNCEMNRTISGITGSNLDDGITANIIYCMIDLDKISVFQKFLCIPVIDSSLRISINFC